MTTAAIPPLPPYPSFHARSQLSHTQLASLNQKVSLSIQQTLDLPPQALNPAVPAPFISSYVRDLAQHKLDALIWDTNSTRAKPRSETTEERTIRARTLLLAERLASTGVLDLTTLLDLSIAYASHPIRLRALFTNAFSSSPSLATTTTTSALPAFTSVLLSHTTTGLHGLRKAAHAILCLLRVGPPELLRAFAHSRDFILALAQSYDAGLGAAASSYGRLYLPVAVAGATQREPDDWEILFLQTKADLLDAFHILFTALLDNVDPAKAKHTLDIVSALHALPVPSKRPDDHTPPTPFLNRSLLADYQHAYDLSEVLTRALPPAAAADDARLKPLTAALHDLDADLDRSGPSAAGQARNQDPGAFRLLLGPDVQLGGATRIGEGDAIAIPSREVEAAATASGSTAVDPRVQEVRAILPDYTPEYVEALLQRTEYGSVERVVEALLEGAAPSPEAIQQQQVTLQARAPQAQNEFEYTHDRRNAFDGEEMEVSRLRIGKKSDDAMTVLRDRSFIGNMKADILRRVEAAPTDSEDDEMNIFGVESDHHVKNKGKSRVREVTFDDELEDVSSVRVAGDGEETSTDEEDEDEGEEVEVEPDLTPQTIVELAYIANPKVFERDAATRRSKERAALRAQTGWVDEQIEGFRIMLDRDPKMKEKILARHEFSGNRSLTASRGWSSSSPGLGTTTTSSSRSHGRSRSRSRSGTPDVPSAARGRGEGGRGGGRRGQGNRGHGRGRGRGRGRGATLAAAGSESGTGTGGGGDGDAQSHARKDKNKARQANHDRKRGHDRKMGKAGQPSS